MSFAANWNKNRLLIFIFIFLLSNQNDFWKIIWSVRLQAYIVVHSSRKQETILILDHIYRPDVFNCESAKNELATSHFLLDEIDSHESEYFDAIIWIENSIISLYLCLSFSKSRKNVVLCATEATKKYRKRRTSATKPFFVAFFSESHKYWRKIVIEAKKNR